jgi:predicted nuclease of restriction endonuclease-like RecB superfamily
VSTRRAPSIADRLADDLAARGHAVEREPPPIAAGEQLLFPDLAVEHGGGRWFVEILGFATQEYVTAKLERYRRAGIDAAVLCIDRANGPGIEADAQVCSFARTVDVDDLLARLRR